MKLKCPIPGCTYETEEIVDAEMMSRLSTHVLSHQQPIQEHGGGTTAEPQKIECPSIRLDSTANDWHLFRRKWDIYKTNIIILDEAAKYHLLQCCEGPLSHSLFKEVGLPDFSKVTLDWLLDTIKALAVVNVASSLRNAHLSSVPQVLGEPVQKFATEITNATPTQMTSNTYGIQNNGGSVTQNNHHSKTVIKGSSQSLTHSDRRQQTAVEPTCRATPCQADMSSTDRSSNGTDSNNNTPTDERIVEQCMHQNMEKSTEATLKRPKKRKLKNGKPSSNGASKPSKVKKLGGGTTAKNIAGKRTAKTVAPKNKRIICHQSTQNELYEYFQMGPTKMKKQSDKVHVIMNNTETSVYQNELEKANKGKDKLFKQMEHLSNPSAEYFTNMIKNIQHKKNPVRQALLHVASSCKLIQEKDKDRLSLIANHSYAMFLLVKDLTAGRKKAETVLDYDLVRRGESPAIAEFLVTLMEELYQRVCADVKPGEARSSKVYALRWLVAGLHKVVRYADAVKLKIGARRDYGRIENEHMINVHQTWGLCHKEEGQLEDALAEMEKAKKMYHESDCENEETIKYVNIYIGQIKELIEDRRHTQ